MAIGFIIGEMGYSGNTVTWYIAAASGVVLGYIASHCRIRRQSKTLLRCDLLCLDALALFKDRSFSVLMLSILS